jgi:hypothetical protein
VLYYRYPACYLLCAKDRLHDLLTPCYSCVRTLRVCLLSAGSLERVGRCLSA